MTELISYVMPDVFDLEVRLDHPEKVAYVTLRVGIGTDTSHETEYYYYNFAVPK